MSVLAILVPVVVAALAALLWCAIAGSWTWRAFVAMWAFGVLLLLLPLVVRP